MRLLSPWAVALLIITDVSAQQVSTNGRCGPSVNLTCRGSQFGNCCSKYNSCGSTSEYCGTTAGCQAKYGTCSGLQSSSSSIRRSTLATSTRTSSRLSSSTIRIETSTRASPSSARTRTSSSTPSATPGQRTINGRCGNKNGATPAGMTCQGSLWGSSCSQWGHCGSTEGFYGTGCQVEFGTCDVPVASSSSSLIQTSSTPVATPSATPACYPRLAEYVSNYGWEQATTNPWYMVTDSWSISHGDSSDGPRSGEGSLRITRLEGQYAPRFGDLELQRIHIPSGATIMASAWARANYLNYGITFQLFIDGAPIGSPITPSDLSYQNFGGTPVVVSGDYHTLTIKTSWAVVVDARLQLANVDDVSLTLTAAPNGETLCEVSTTKPTPNPVPSPTPDSLRCFTPLSEYVPNYGWEQDTVLPWKGKSSNPAGWSLRRDSHISYGGSEGSVGTLFDGRQGTVPTTANFDVGSIGIPSGTTVTASGRVFTPFYEGRDFLVSVDVLIDGTSFGRATPTGYGWWSFGGGSVVVSGEQHTLTLQVTIGSSTWFAGPGYPAGFDDVSLKVTAAPPGYKLCGTSDPPAFEVPRSDPTPTPIATPESTPTPTPISTPTAVCYQPPSEYVANYGWEQGYTVDPWVSITSGWSNRFVNNKDLTHSGYGLMRVKTLKDSPSSADYTQSGIQIPSGSTIKASGWGRIAVVNNDITFELLLDGMSLGNPLTPTARTWQSFGGGSMVVSGDTHVLTIRVSWANEFEYDTDIAEFDDVSIKMTAAPPPLTMCA